MLAAMTACRGQPAANSSPSGEESSPASTTDQQIPEQGDEKPVGTKDPAQTSEPATPVELDEERDSLPSVMTPDTPVAVQLIFPGDLPAYGISYVDAGGNLRRFAIEVSGYDGSVLLEEADPLETQFILPGEISR